MQCGRVSTLTYADARGRKRHICRACLFKKQSNLRTKSKFGNKPTKVSAGTADSKGEAKRFEDLKLLEMAGEIKNLKFHPKYDIEINGVKICSYEADSSYYDMRRFMQVVEDAKGCRTEVFKLKKRLMLAIYGIDVEEFKL